LAAAHARLKEIEREKTEKTPSKYDPDYPSIFF
jgi:hypothetical protein